MTSNGKKKRVWLRVLLGILIGIAAVIGGVVAFALLGKEATMAQLPHTVPLDDVADGVYEGSYAGFRWSNTLQVTVQDHLITNITVTQPQTVIKEETMATLEERVLEAQSPDVDTVAEATVDSKAYLKAVENALISAAAE